MLNLYFSINKSISLSLSILFNLWCNKFFIFQILYFFLIWDSSTYFYFFNDCDFYHAMFLIENAPLPNCNGLRGMAKVLKTYGITLASFYVWNLMKTLLHFWKLSRVNLISNISLDVISYFSRIYVLWI